MTEAPIDRLLAIMARLRSPEDGCPWDVAQTFATIAPYTIEEAYEVADAIERGDLADLKGELGDLLFQVVFHARMAEEAGAFDFDDVAQGIVDKMTRRHPHLFGGEPGGWDEIKARERSAKGAASLLDDVPCALPALVRAVKLSKRAAGVGFVWPTIAEVMAKLAEEVAELEAEIAAGDQAKAADELGDILFVCANIGRHLGIDPEAALAGSNAKFTRRFQFIETALAEQGRTPADATLDEMEALWQAAKATPSAASARSGPWPGR